jgi:Spy/CpxP family protein refolding chaperone
MAAFIGLVFVVGMAVGAIVRPYLESVSATQRFPGPPSPDALVAIFTKELNLTPVQQTQLEKILRARRDTFDAFGEGIRQRMDAERDRMLADIDKLLTPEQRVRFESMNRKMREHPRPLPPFVPPPSPR